LVAHVDANLNIPSTPSLPGASSGLTQRESQVLALVAKGLTNREVGEALFLSPQTIKGYVATIFEKIGVRNRVEASLFVFRSSDSTE
jgi:DNA-binding NarL/FixJ family response regulator